MSLVVDKLTGNIYLFDFNSTGGTGTSGSTYSEVNSFADLPSPALFPTKIFVVRTSTGVYVINRKEAGLYYSNGLTWTRLGDIPSFFNDDNFQIYDGTDNSKTIRFELSGLTTSTQRKLIIQNASGTVAYLSDVDPKLDISDFNTYSGITSNEINSKLDIDDFNVYSAETSNKINDKLDVGDFNTYSGITSNLINTVKEYAAYGIGTGFISGGTMTHSGGTVFTVNAGNGLYIDQYSDTNNPIIIPVSWNNTNLTVLSGSLVTYVTVSSGGTFIRREANPTPEQRREEIFLGVVIHAAGTISFINQSALPAYDILPTSYDLANAIGLIKTDDGNQITPNGNNLSLIKTAGSIFFISTNIRVNNKNPNFRSFPETNPVVFQYRDIESVDYGNRTTVDPTKYEKVVGNTSTIETITGSTAQATVQRVYLFQSGGVRIQYGQKVYESLEDAFHSFINDPFIVEKDIDEDGLLIGALVLRTETTNLNNGSDVIFINSDRYGSLLGVSSGRQFVVDHYQLIKSLADFPEPIGNSIFLQDNFTYQINGLVNIGNKQLVVGESNSFIGLNSSTDILMSTGLTIPLIYGRGKNVTLSTLTMQNLNGNVFDLVGNNLKNVIIRRLNIVGSKGGKIGGYGFTLFENVGLFDMTGGFIFSGQSTNQGEISIRSVLLKNITSGNTVFTITGGSFNSIDLSLNYFNVPTGAIALKINSGTTLTTNGAITSNEFFGGGTYLNGSLTKAAANWIFNGNINLLDSETFGFLKFSGNTDVTIITATTQYVKAAGSNTVSASERFIVTNNRLTNNSNKTLNFIVIFTGDISTGGNVETLQVALMKNGVTRVGTVEVRTGSANDAVPFAYNDIVSLAHGEYVEIYVRNFTSVADITLRSLQFRINRPA